MSDERAVKHALTFAVVMHATIAAAQPAPATQPAPTTQPAPANPAPAPPAPAQPANPAPTTPAPAPPAPTTPASTTPAPAPPAPTTPASTNPAPAQPAPAQPTPANSVEPAKPQVTNEEDAPPKLSLPTEADREAWTRPGFRLELGLTYGQFHGLRGAPSGRLLGPKLRAGLRLDRDWSLMTSFEYTSAKRSGGLSGLRFAGTIDPTWHVTRALAVAVGFGFAGIVEGSTSRMDADPLPDTIESSYTFPDASHPIASCSGVGAAGLVRGEYGYVIGPRATLRVEAEAIGQWTGCSDDSGRVEPDTGQAIERHQWWPHVGGTLTVGVMWR